VVTPRGPLPLRQHHRHQHRRHRTLSDGDLSAGSAILEDDESEINAVDSDSLHIRSVDLGGGLQPQSRPNALGAFGSRRAEKAVAAGTALAGRTPKGRWEESRSRSESGIGYLAATQRIDAADGDSTESSAESLVARERDISVDDEYHHVAARPLIACDPAAAEGTLHRKYSESSASAENVSGHDFETMVVHQKVIGVHPSRDPVVDGSDAMITRNGLSEDGLEDIDGATASVVDSDGAADDGHSRSAKNGSNATASPLRIEPGTASKGIEVGNGRHSPSEVSISRMSGDSLSIPSIRLDAAITAKGTKTKRTGNAAPPSMAVFSQKIESCAAAFGHHRGGVAPDDDRGSDEESGDRFATTVIHPLRSSAIPQSQIRQNAVDREADDVPFGGVHQFLDAQSTETMIVKNVDSERTAGPLSAVQQTASSALLSDDDSTESSEDGDRRDPIDASEDEQNAERLRHRKNRSRLSEKSQHSRSMVITDDLNIAHLAASFSEALGRNDDDDDTE